MHKDFGLALTGSFAFAALIAALAQDRPSKKDESGIINNFTEGESSN